MNGRDFCMSAFGVILYAIVFGVMLHCAGKDITSIVEPSPVVCLEEDSTAMGSCTICNSEIATPYYSRYAVCDSIARRRGMSVCRWAQLDVVPEGWD